MMAVNLKPATSKPIYNNDPGIQANFRSHTQDTAKLLTPLILNWLLHISPQRTHKDSTLKNDSSLLRFIDYSLQHAHREYLCLLKYSENV